MSPVGKLSPDDNKSNLKVTWDHKHQMDNVEPYEFESAGQLLGDFSKAVEKWFGG